MIPESPQGRFRWALSESLILVGIFAAWAVITALVGILSQLSLALLRPVLSLPHPLFELLQATGGVWRIAFSVATLTACLSVLVRAGTLIVSHYVETTERTTPSETQTLEG
ncbi:hypothetical protein B2G88_08150 [Natronolimnobius baerhuensis]|uniref:Uncharacterized protein n=1 Tax=Natronolimnobius baerhuensis TaxID=253108 RepID=A0A202E7W9_9EURY|nr:hypothetical protein B2G88_08150 [Natronolimnobius baerhuensis]